MIQPVILAGGSGTRLWPASRQSHPKQLLALTGDLSLLQETVLRLSGFASGSVAPDPVVVTGEDYRFLVADQLRDIGVPNPLIVLEPEGRNTAPALTLASLLLPDTADDPMLLIMASDHLIKDIGAFHAAVEEGARQALAGRVVTFGIVPDRPHTGYGYIHVGGPVSSSGTARVLLGFTEKPDAATAAQYLATGDYLWNSGMYMMSRSVWLRAITRYRPEIEAACRSAVSGRWADGLFVRLDRAAFVACPSESIDYAVMEQLGSAKAASAGPDSAGKGAVAGTGGTGKLAGVGGGAAGKAAGAGSGPAGMSPPDTEAVVIPLDAGWSDVGAWSALWEVSEKDEGGNATKGAVILEDTRGSLVHSSSRLVTVLGADDLVVVETADAVLVAARDKTEDLKKLVARVREHDENLMLAHRSVHRPWGRFDSVDSGARFQVKRIVVSPGASLSLQLHHRRAEHWVVVHGVAEVTCGDKVFRLEEDESTYVPVGTPHRLRNPGDEPLEIIEVQSGDYLGEDDIVRLEDSYGRLHPEDV